MSASRQNETNKIAAAAAAALDVLSKEAGTAASKVVDTAQSVKISNQSGITLGLTVSICVAAAAISGSFWAVKTTVDGIKEQYDRIETTIDRVSSDVATTRESVARINGKLDSILSKPVALTSSAN